MRPPTWRWSSIGPFPVAKPTHAVNTPSSPIPATQSFLPFKKTLKARMVGILRARAARSTYLGGEVGLPAATLKSLEKLR